MDKAKKAPEWLSNELLKRVTGIISYSSKLSEYFGIYQNVNWLCK